MHDIGRDASSSYAEGMSDGTWMTYAELAALRRINQASAFKLAFRHRWRRQKNNTGQMTVFVPSAWSDTSQDNAHDMSRQTEAFRGDPTDLTRAVSALEAAVSTLRDQLVVASGRADRAEVGREAERARADRAEAATDAANSRADGAEARADRAEARADRAEAGRDANLARADAMQAERDQALAVAHEAVQAAVVEKADAAEQARRRATMAQEGAAALRQADAARRGRGRLARLRAAWRGE
jgi:hypothetical protein